MLRGNVQALFGAGSDTVRASVEWALLVLANDQELQSKLHNEIDTIIGRDRLPSWTDRPHLPLMQAFLSEVQRWKTIVPLNLIRCTTEDTYVQGHLIPKGTSVLANFWGVHNDPKVWESP